MIVRVVPYAEISVSVTLTEKEADALADVLATARERGDLLPSSAVAPLEQEVCEALDRADALKKQRGY